MRSAVFADVGFDLGIERVELSTGVEHGITPIVDDETTHTVGRDGIKAHRLVIERLHLWI